MAFPTILINNSTGSNTAASGAGPGTALSGSGASITSASADVNLSADTPNLSGVATDGSAVIYVNNASGKKFGRITAVNDGTDIVTVSPGTFGTTGSGRGWAIGGKRKDFENVNGDTKTLFLADAAAGWTIDIEETGSDYVLTVTTTIGVNGNQTDGRILVKSSSGTRPTITSATNSCVLFTYGNGGNYMEFRHLNLTHTAGTRGGAFTRSAGTIAPVFYTDLVIDGCSTLWTSSTSVSNPTLIGCEIKNTTLSTAALLPNTATTIRMFGCDVHNNTGDGVRPGIMVSTHCIFSENVVGINDTTGATATATIILANCVIAGNSSDGIKNTTAKTAGSGILQIGLENNIIYGNGGRDVNCASTQVLVDADLFINRNNAIGGNGSARLGLSAGTNDVTLSADPFLDSGTRDYSLNTDVDGGELCKAAGFPGDFPGGTTAVFQDIGLQHQDTGGGGSGGLIQMAGMTGGMQRT